LIHDLIRLIVSRSSSSALRPMFRLLRSGLSSLIPPLLAERVTRYWMPNGPRKIKRRAFASNLVAAGLSAIVTFAYAGSFGQLVFSGALAPWVGQGILAALVSSIAVLLILSWYSSLQFSVGGPDSNPSAVLAVTLASLVQQVSASAANAGELLPTILMFVFVSAFGTGIVVWLLGSRRWGRYVRYIPHPVVGGFLAGTGFLLVMGASKMLIGEPLRWSVFDQFAAVHPLGSITAFMVAALLVVLTRRVKHYLVIPSVILGGVIAFHVSRVVLGIDLESARREGLLLPGLELDSWQSMVSLPLGDVRWDLILTHAKDFAAMTIVVIVTGLMNTTSLELATGCDADADRELRAIGIGNLVAGFFGGMVASNSFNRSVLNLNAGGTSRWAARLCAVIILLVMTLTPGLVGFLPRGVLTGLILFLGISLLITWVVDARRRLVLMDYLVVIAILGIVAVFGIVTGVVCGIFIACVTLAVTLSRSPNVRHAFTAENRRANVERSREQLTRLRTEGQALRGYSLQGVLFFGTAIRLLDEVRLTLRNTKIVLLDFRLIHGVDGSAIVVLKRVQTVCHEAGVQLVLTGLSTPIASVLSAGGFAMTPPQVWHFPDLDHGLEWAEEFMLGTAEAPSSLAEVLDEALSRVGTRLLLEVGEQRRLGPGERLARQGEPSNEFMFVISGRVQILMRIVEQNTETVKRLRSFGPGSIVGEMGFFSGEPRSADIVAEVASEVLCITRTRYAEIERLHPTLARDLTRHIINTLAQRVRSSNEEIRLLL
jgi:SulP family sulfate permease